MIPYTEYSDSTGDGTGTTNMAVDGSSTPQIFKVKPTYLTRIGRCIFRIEGSGTITPDSFGVLPALTNGVTIGWYRSSTGTRLNNVTPANSPIKANDDLASLMYDVNSQPILGTGSDLVTGRWTFFNYSNGWLVGGASDREIRVTIQDDLSTLTEFTITFEGSTAVAEYPGGNVGDPAQYFFRGGRDGSF